MVKCNIKGCKKRVMVEYPKPGQTILYYKGSKDVEAYCSEAHWEQHLKEVLPRH